MFMNDLLKEGAYCFTLLCYLIPRSPITCASNNWKKNLNSMHTLQTWYSEIHQCVDYHHYSAGQLVKVKISLLFVTTGGIIASQT